MERPPHLVGQMDVVCFSPLAGIRLVERKVSHDTGYSLNSFSPLAGIRLVESRVHPIIRKFLIGFQSPCGD